MNNTYLLLLVGFLYIVVFGGLSYLRREGWSLRFALEGCAVTLIFAALSQFAGVQTHPLIFLIVIYLITMRVRMLIDIANGQARRGRHTMAARLYHLALNLFPDAANRLMIKINQGVSCIQQGDLDRGIQLINEALSQRDDGFLGVRTEAACYFNLAIAHRRKNMESRAMEYFRKVIDTWPVSEYGRRAQAELNKGKTGG